MKDWALGFSYDFLVSSLNDVNNVRTGAPEFIIGFRKYIGKNKKAEIGDITPAPVVTPVKPEEKPVTPPDEVKPEEPKKPVDEVKPTTPVEEAKPEPTKDEQVQKVEDKQVVEPKKEPTPADVERERARKRQIYMTPVGFQGTDPFAGSRVSLSKEDRDFLGKSVKFKLNGYELSPESARHLEKVAKVLKKHPNLKIDIRGFGCDLGSPEVNLKISQGRANATKAFLVRRGVPAKQLRAKGYGTLKPEDDIKVD
jgi:outer membrane protein OmpA-like peptidoglycan-associated protein